MVVYPFFQVIAVDLLGPIFAPRVLAFFEVLILLFLENKGGHIHIQDQVIDLFSDYDRHERVEHVAENLLALTLLQVVVPELLGKTLLVKLSQINLDKSDILLDEGYPENREVGVQGLEVDLPDNEVPLVLLLVLRIRLLRYLKRIELKNQRRSSKSTPFFG